MATLPPVATVPLALPGEDEGAGAGRSKSRGPSPSAQLRPVLGLLGSQNTIGNINPALDVSVVFVLSRVSTAAPLIVG